MIGLTTLDNAKKEIKHPLDINWTKIEGEIAERQEVRQKKAASIISRVSLLVYGALALSIGIGLLVK